MTAPIDKAMPENLSLNLGLGILLGLFTGGLYWAFVFPRWSRRHAEYKTRILLKRKIAPRIAAQIKRRSRRTCKLGLAVQIMGSIALATLATAFLWEEVLHLGGFPLPEEPFWFFCWVTLSVLALTWGSLAYELRAIMDAEDGGDGAGRPWLLSGPQGRIPVMIALNVVFALGILPLVIFPPIAASAVNGYLRNTQQPGTSESSPH